MMSESSALETKSYGKDDGTKDREQVDSGNVSIDTLKCKSRYVLIHETRKYGCELWTNFVFKLYVLV